MSMRSCTHGGVEWLNLLHPSAEDIETLGGRFPNFHPLNLQDCLTDLEIPKINHYDGYLFLVVQMPYWDAAQRISRPAEVDIFITPEVLVTSHRGELKALNAFYERVAQNLPEEEWAEHRAAGLLYAIVNELVEGCFPMIRKISSNLRMIEEELFSENTRQLLYEVAILRRDIITMHAILHAQVEIVDALVRNHWQPIPEALIPYWGDVSDHLRQLVAALEQYAEVIAGLSDSIDTLASHSIDEVVRLLTFSTVLTLPVTLLATLFGMNVLMPFSQHPALFFVISIFAVGITIWLAWYLRKKKWL